MYLPGLLFLRKVFRAKTAYLGAHLVYDAFRPGDADIASDSHDPAEELIADGDIHGGPEMIVIDRHDGNIFSEAVDQYADHIVMGLHGDTDLFTAVHAERGRSNA